MKRMHLRHPKFPSLSICCEWRAQDWQLTDDPKSVTCKGCLKKMEQVENHEAKGK